MMLLCCRIRSGLTIPAPIGGGGLASTASDDGVFDAHVPQRRRVQGARVLKPETVKLMSENAIGTVRVPALKAHLPRSVDFTFITWTVATSSSRILMTTRFPQRSPGSLRATGGIIFLRHRPNPRHRRRDHGRMRKYSRHSRMRKRCRSTTRSARTYQLVSATR